MRVGLCVIGWVLAAVGLLPAEPTAFVPAERKAFLQSGTIKEASGIAASSLEPGLFWLINDSGAGPELHLLEANGTARGVVALKHARNTDWEDLASFSIDGKAYLLVADTGDNDAKRDHCTLYVLREPAAPAPGGTIKGNAAIEWMIRFRYEGGPRDCESVAVDVPRKKILLLSKRTHPPELHELPLEAPAKRGILTTQRICNANVSAPADSLIPFRDQPTGMDITADNSLAAVVTYYGVFLFSRKPEDSWREAFSNKPVILDPHGLAQAESIAFAKDGGSLLLVSEGQGSPILRYERKVPARSD